MPDELKSFNSFGMPWSDFPCSMPEGIDIFAIGDVHDQHDLLEQVRREIIYTAREASKRHIVILGDLIDRAPASNPCCRFSDERRAPR